LFITVDVLKAEYGDSEIPGHYGRIIGPRIRESKSIYSKILIQPASLSPAFRVAVLGVIMVK